MASFLWPFLYLVMLKINVLNIVSVFFSDVVIHVPAAERPRFLSQSKCSPQRPEAAESPHKQSKYLCQ